MIKEYKWIGNTYMTNLMIDVNKDACNGWRLVNVVHNGGYFAAVLEREKIDDKTCSLLVQALKYADLHIIELPVDVIKSKESLLSDIRFFIKEFTSRMSEEE